MWTLTFLTKEVILAGFAASAPKAVLGAGLEMSHMVMNKKAALGRREHATRGQYFAGV